VRLYHLQTIWLIGIGSKLAPVLKIPKGCLGLEDGAILHTGTAVGRNFKRKGG
jgi:hypothetical protein